MGTTIAILGLGWIVGGGIFIGGAMRHADQDFRDWIEGLRRLDPAAIVATVAFMVIWPAVFIAAKIGRSRRV